MIQQLERQLATNRYDSVHADLVATFGAPMHNFALNDQLKLLMRAFPDPARIAGISLLDIGCGCVQGSAEVNACGGTWEPWLCRAVTLLGGLAVGVDLGVVGPKDTFEYHRCDLIRRDPLSQFADQSFDVVSCSNLLSSPHLVYKQGQSREQREALGIQIERHMARILKSGGIILNFDRHLDNH